MEPALAGKEQFAESLAQRREKRRTCNCDRCDLIYQILPVRLTHTVSPEPGICQLFDFRAGEPIIHDNEITSELPKTSESPDRVYGLRMTSRLRKLLQNSQDQRPSSGGKTIGESIKTTPYRFNGEHLIFPFLALEAKSEKSEDSSSAIELQTAFTIRTLLKLQQDLRDASSEVGRTGESPLVWFLQYRGEVWRVSAAFTEVERDEQTYVRIFTALVLKVLS